MNYYAEPLDHETLVRLLGEMNARPREIMRKNEKTYRELDLKNRDLRDEELIELMLRYPELIQRPILEVGARAVLGRPAERMTALLEESTGSG